MRLNQPAWVGLQHLRSKSVLAFQERAPFFIAVGIALGLGQRVEPHPVCRTALPKPVADRPMIAVEARPNLLERVHPPNLAAYLADASHSRVRRVRSPSARASAPAHSRRSSPTPWPA